MKTVNKKLYDNRSALQVIGCLIREPELMEEYPLDKSDFEVESFHEIVYSCVYNLYQQGVQVIDDFAIDSYLSKYSKQYKIFESNNGIEWCNDAVVMAEPSNFSFYHSRLKKFSYLRFLDNRGLDVCCLYDYSVCEPVEQEKEMEKLDSRTIKEMIDIVDTKLTVEARMRFEAQTFHGIQAGKGLRELKEKLKEEPDWGLPMRSTMFTTATRGARLGKMYLKSSNSGGGKSRLAESDIALWSVPYYYDSKEEKWIHTGFSEPSLYISAELQFDELQTILAANIADVPEDHIINGTYEGDEEERVDKAIAYIEQAPLYFVHMPNFSIADVKNIIKKYHREKGCNYFVMDYIHMTQQLITEISSMSRGMKLREDQILFLFADELKNLCNDLNIFILAITQLNDKYNETTIRNESLLRGAKSLADRIDCGCIDLKPTKQELDAVKNIISHIVGCPPINLVRHVYKLRRGKLSKIRIFQSVDLGTCRVRDVFATNFDGELIPIDATNIENLDNIIEDNSINPEELEAGTEQEQKEAHKLFKLDF